MEVYLAGYNVDTAVLRELEEKCGKRDDLTPEVLSAAYARISRDARPINESPRVKKSKNPGDPTRPSYSRWVIIP